MVRVGGVFDIADASELVSLGLEPPLGEGPLGGLRGLA